jgi:predicted AAA+ superfamily ATPase
VAVSNHERVGRALELLRSGLGPFVEREIDGDSEMPAQWGVSAILNRMKNAWDDVFRRTLGQAESGLVNELLAVHSRWEAQQTFSSDDAYRALDSAGRLLTAISATQADEIEKMKTELLRQRFDEQARSDKRRSAGTAIESAAASSLKSWREVVTPHKDVASGRYQQAEFAADLWQVHLNQGTDEYRDPVEFFRRTYLTESLRSMLVGAVRRLSGLGGDPVIQLQTNFGGGKTHSMLALYHLFSGTKSTELAGIDEVVEEALGKKTAGRMPALPAGLPAVRRVVLVGNKISPGNPATKADGTVVRTLWGELAWQLGGRKAFARIQADDERATSPGDVLRELFVEHGPCLILIDEWVAYARQLHDQSDLPAGGFETQFTFAQVLTESAKLAPSCLLVISLPASDTAGSPHTQADNVEVGGQRGREALDRLRNVVGRVESSWRPASAEEGFEIVRRRLFEPISDPKQFEDRDVVARAFADFYRSQQAELPPECRTADYEKRIRAAYPIHPEVFDRLYNDWSTLVKFQRTRGVLRLMAAVIHSLWEKGDKNPLILPANISIDDPRVQFELTRYLTDNWVPVIAADVDGPSSLPLRMDSDIPNLGKLSACRRVARTIYLGSAPLTQAAHRGLEERRVKLGCMMPGESPQVFGDALRRLAGAATYLYQDGARYWYSTQPTVTKLAEDRAEQLQREPDKVEHEIDQRLRADLRARGDFSAVHPVPTSGYDVPDTLNAGLVVLGVNHPYAKEPESPAETFAKAILEFRGNAPRLFRNTLVFLAADKTRLQDLDEAVRKLLAWESILAEGLILDLTPQQVRQAETQKAAAEGDVKARIPETYQWLLVPVQASAGSAIELQAQRLPSGQEPLAVRASRKLRSDELLITSFGATRLRMELDRVPLWPGNHVALKQLAEYFASYPHLPRLKDTSVLIGAVRDGLTLLTWQQESFAFADSFDEEAGRYRGLRGGQGVSLSDTDPAGLLVKGEVAQAQLDATHPPEPLPDARARPAVDSPGSPPFQPGLPGSASIHPRRFHGTVTLDPSRVGRDASRIAEEVIAHLGGLVGAKVTVTLEIEAEIPSGTPDHVVRTVTENSRTLKFTSHGFETD